MGCVSMVVVCSSNLSAVFLVVAIREGLSLVRVQILDNLRLEFLRLWLLHVLGALLRWNALTRNLSRREDEGQFVLVADNVGLDPAVRLYRKGYCRRCVVVGLSAGPSESAQKLERCRYVKVAARTITHFGLVFRSAWRFFQDFSH